MRPQPRPYDLYWFKHPDDTFARIVEVMSHPVPGNRIMIRRVPGEPTTLEEISTDWLGSEASDEYKYVHFARAEPATGSGTYSFPEDMLRYDVAYLFDSKLMIVARVSKSSQPDWTTERWWSFGWTLHHIRTNRIGVADGLEVNYNNQSKKSD